MDMEDQMNSARLAVAVGTAAITVAGSWPAPPEGATRPSDHRRERLAPAGPGL
jgi:hypothetical protein